MAQEKLLSQSNRNLSKAQIDARQKAEQMVVTNPTTPKPDEVTKINRPMRLLFNKLRKLNDHFTEADSVALNTLVFSLHMRQRSQLKLVATDELDESYAKLLTHIEKHNKQINESMKQLCLPLNARLSLANDMAKVMIEEKKLEQMNQANVITVNPLQSLLEDDDDE